MKLYKQYTTLRHVLWEKVWLMLSMNSSMLWICSANLRQRVLNWPVDRTCASTGVLGEYRIGYTVHLWAWPEATRGHHVPGGHGQPVSSSAQDCPVISRIQFQPIPFLAWRSTVQVSVIVPTLTANPSDDLSLAASYLLQLQIGFIF